MSRPRFWVMLTVIGVLLFCGILTFFPVYGYPKTKARAGQCMSNVKQNAVALQLYASDYNELLPDRDLWMDAIVPYTKHEPFHCPDLMKAGRMDEYGYCVNASLKTLHNLPSPEVTPLVFESVNLARNASGGIDSLPKPGRHEGSNSVAFADGHAKKLRDGAP